MFCWHSSNGSGVNFFFKVVKFNVFYLFVFSWPGVTLHANKLDHASPKKFDWKWSLVHQRKKCKFYMINFALHLPFKKCLVLHCNIVANHVQNVRSSWYRWEPCGIRYRGLRRWHCNEFGTSKPGTFNSTLGSNLSGWLIDCFVFYAVSAVFQAST